MAIKIVLFDVDGVIAIPPLIFSQRIAQNYNLSMKSVNEFFKGPFQKCLRGEADLKEELPVFLQKWGITESIDEVMRFWFEGENVIDTRMIKVMKKLRAAGIKLYLATNQEKYRADYIKNEMGLGKLVDGSFISKDFGVKKDNKLFFELVMKTLIGVQPAEILFWDDDPEHVVSAAQVGIKAELYNSHGEFVQKIIPYFPQTNFPS